MADHEARGLFVNELGRMHGAEHKAIQMMEQFQKESPNQQEFQQALALHITQTREQIRNLEECARIVGQPLPKPDSPIPDGFVKTHQEILQQNPSTDLHTMIDMGLAHEYESFEAGVYGSLIAAAEAMNQSECVNLLRQNLDQERLMGWELRQMLSRTASGVAKPQRRAA